jgi:hypothetical protein
MEAKHSNESPPWLCEYQYHRPSLPCLLGACTFYRLEPLTHRDMRQVLYVFVEQIY